MDTQEQLLTIQQLSLKLKIPKPTLRYWEKEFEDILVPLRSPGGQRRYTAGNITRIAQIKKLKQKGMSLAEIRHELHNNYENGGAGLHNFDVLAEKIVAEVVREEVYRFFKGRRI